MPSKRGKPQPAVIEKPTAADRANSSGPQKVKQSTIDEIKGMGMQKALERAAQPTSAEFREGVRRMYGQKRLDKVAAANQPAKVSGTSVAKKSVTVSKSSSHNRRKST